MGYAQGKRVLVPALVNEYKFQKFDTEAPIAQRSAHNKMYWSRTL